MGPPPSKGGRARRLNRTKLAKKNPPTHPPLFIDHYRRDSRCRFPQRGGGDPKSRQLRPPPVGKAGFDVWVRAPLRRAKGGIEFVLATCRPTCTVPSHHPLVHANLLGRYADPSGACVYRYGPVTKCNPFLRYVLVWWRRYYVLLVGEKELWFRGGLRSHAVVGAVYLALRLHAVARVVLTWYFGGISRSNSLELQSSAHVQLE